MTIPKVPQWLLVSVAFFLMALVAYSVSQGYTVKFWPPEILPQQPTSSPPIVPPSVAGSGPGQLERTQWEYKVVDRLSDRTKLGNGI